MGEAGCCPRDGGVVPLPVARDGSKDELLLELVALSAPRLGAKVSVFNCEVCRVLVMILG